MLKTLTYLLGTLTLHFVDLNHASGFYSIFLPFIAALFLIFLCWQLMFFMVLNDSFSDGGHYHFNDLLIDIYDLRYDIQDDGLPSALFNLALNLFEVACFFLSIFYYFTMMIDLIIQ